MPTTLAPTSRLDPGRNLVSLPLLNPPPCTALAAQASSWPPSSPLPSLSSRRPACTGWSAPSRASWRSPWWPWAASSSWQTSPTPRWQKVRACVEFRSGAGARQDVSCVVAGHEMRSVGPCCGGPASAFPAPFGYTQTDPCHFSPTPPSLQPKGLFIPRLPRSTIAIACGLLGAIIMPHNLFLHSALVHSRQAPGPGEAGCCQGLRALGALAPECMLLGKRCAPKTPRLRSNLCVRTPPGSHHAPTLPH